MILVVGATGQVGNLAVRRLAAQGRQVRALVHGPTAGDALSGTGADVAIGDLRDVESLRSALVGVDSIVATANVVAPSRPGDTHRAVEERGYSDLIDEAARVGVRRFVYASVPVTSVDDQVPQLRAKRIVERRLAVSGIPYLSLRFAPFIEVWLALVGSSIPLRGERNATLDRPYRFLRAFRRLSGRTIEDRGLLVVPGPASNRNAFISVHDAAAVLVAAVYDVELTGAVDVGGPQVLSWADVAEIYSKIVGRRVRVLSVPGVVFVVLQKVIAPVAPAASNIMGMNRLIAGLETDWDTRDVNSRLGVAPLRTVEEVLREKAALPAIA